MDFNPANNIIQLCLRGMEQETKNNPEAAYELFMQAWNEAVDDFEKYTAAFYVARHQKNATDRLTWTETTLAFALKVNNDAVKSAFPTLYARMAQCYRDLNDPENTRQYEELAAAASDKLPDNGPFYHGTRADLQVGDLLTAGFGSNYNAEVTMNHIYFTALVNGAGLAAELAKGDGRERVYIVEPTGSFENDPNVTDKKFPGNPTRSYRSQAPLKIIGEVADWVRQSPEAIRQWREKLANVQKGDIIN